MKTLFEMVNDKVVKMVLNGEMGMREVRHLDWTSERTVMEKLRNFDLSRWRFNIMESLATIELSKSKNYHVEWEKFYMDGMRDFREVVYIQHDGDEIITSELTDDEFSDDEDFDHEPIIKAKIVDCNSQFYHNYMDAIYKLNKDQYQDDLSEQADYY
jgi:hypothetical protein